MKLGYVIYYVPDVAASLAFCERAFGLTCRFRQESGGYGELETGGTALSFASHEVCDSNFRGGHARGDRSIKPLGMEIALVCENVAAAHARAIGEGASELAAPALKPWGQMVSYVRCPDGLLVELCSPLPA